MKYQNYIDNVCFYSKRLNFLKDGIHTYFWASTLLKCISERDSQLDINFQSRMNQLVKQNTGSGMFVLQNRNVNRSNVFNYS